jgi:alcohol dehydrogenase class IV
MTCAIQIPSSIHAGKGSIDTLSEIIERDSVKRIVLFTDKGVRNAGLCERALSICNAHKVEYQIFDGIAAEPSVQDVDRVIQAASDVNADLLLAIGGGSVMDTAKLASVLIGASYTLQDLVRDASQARKMIRSIMVPTTCGTGSEATCNAIVAIPEERSKKGIVNTVMIPDEVILDVNMIARLPKGSIAATGVDALAHGIECYTSKKATMLSNIYALACVKLIFSSIERAYVDPDAFEAKMHMMLGAFYGGIAITGSGTTAVHALSYPLGGKYHIPHGVSNAMLFAPVMAFNRDACVQQLSEICDAVNPHMASASCDEKSLYVVDRIAQVVKNTEIPVSLEKFGITTEDIDSLVTAGSQQQRLLVNNQKELSLDDIRSIYQQVL